MASWFTRAIDRITPWDRGGEVERRKKREEEQRQQQSQGQVQRRPQNNYSFQNQPSGPVVQQPEKTIAGRDFSIGLDINNQVQVPQRSEYDVKPDENKPKQSFFNKVRDQFDANTEADQYRRRRRNELTGENKEVALKNAPNIGEKATVPIRSAFRVITGIGQGASGLADLVTPGKGSSRVTNKLNEMSSKLDEDARKQNLETPYKVGNVVGEIGSYFTPGVVSKGGKVGGFTSKIGNKVDDIIKLGDDPGRVRKLVSDASREFLDPVNLEQEARLTSRYLGQDSARGEEITPRVVAENVLQSLAGAFVAPAVRGLNRIRRGRAGNLTDEVVDTATSAGSGIPTAVKNIPVAQDIPVQQVPGEEIPIPVRTPDAERPIIRELEGDAINVTQVPTQVQASEQRAANRFQNQNFGMPDERIEGVTPRNPESDMITLGDAKGPTQIEIDTERVMLDEALANGEINKTQHKTANKALDEITPTDAPTPKGQPIEVREVDSIPVRDETVVPQGLPENPGTVRATTATAPAKAQTEAVAKQSAPVPVQKSEFDEGGLPKTNASEETKVPASIEEAGIGDIFDNIVKGLRDNQKAYRAEKKLTTAEKKRRFANYNRIYDEARASGKSSQEAEALAKKAMGGQYTKGVVDNVEIDQASRDILFDKASKSKDGMNVKRAFDHMFDPNRTEPLRNWERTRIRRFLQNEVGEEKALALEEAIMAAEKSGDRSMGGRVADFLTSAVAAGDISAVGRQGLSGLINHPKMSKNAWDEALQALIHSDGEERFAKKLIDDPDTAFIQENMGGKYLTLSDIADEGRGPDTTNRAISWYVDPSNRHYNTYLDALRHQQKKTIIERYGGQEGFLTAAQKANPENPEKWMKAWNNVIDRQSGRGSFSAKGSPTVGDIQVLFSARNLASKVQRLTAPLQLGLLKTNPQAYLYQLKETATQAAVLGSTLALLNASGIVDIENGKLKVGKTRIDITGGFATIINSLNNVRKAMGIMHDTSEDPSFGRSGGDIVKDFFQNQLAPTIGSLVRLTDVDFSKGEDKYGNKVDAKWWLQTVPMPAVAQTAIDSAVEGETFWEGARNVFADALGFNTNTYMSAEDKDNEARGKTAPEVNAGLQKLKDTGLLSEDMIASIDDEEIQNILSGQSDKQLSEDELGKITSKLVEGISAEMGPDSDSAYRERGDYKLDKAALELKKQELESKPNPKPSDIKALDVQIKRSELLDKNQIPFELLDSYQSIGVEDWRKMGDPEDDMYDPDMYQQLWAIDELMAKDGVSYAKGKLDKQKYSEKESKSGGRGRGGRSSKRISADFGKLSGSGSNAPKVREYQTLEQSSGVVPRIKLTQPNIVHTIKAGRL